jgi:hypothetical protein
MGAGDGGKSAGKSAPFPVVLCGGSNGTAYFSGLWSSGRLPSGAHPVRVVTRRPERFAGQLTVKESVQPAKGTVFGDSVFAPIVWQEYKSGPVQAFKYGEMDKALEGAECVWLCAPVNAYADLLRAVMPAAAREAARAGRGADNPLMVCCMYGQGGFEWLALSFCAGLQLPPGLALVQLKNFPALISRTSEHVVENFGFHPNAAWFAATPPEAGSAALRMCKTLFATCGHEWSVQELRSPLLCTLGGSNQLLHTCIIGGLLGDAPGRTFAAQPKVYRNLPWRSFQLMASVWKETMLLAETLEKVMDVPILDKVGFHTVVRNMMKLQLHHWPEPVVAMAVWGAINGTSRLRAAKLPVVKNPYRNDRVARETDTNGEFVFNVDHRFIVDDVPYGLCVLYGLAEIVDCPMPATAKLICDLQLFLRKEYLVVKGARFVLAGRDALETGAPQAYGVKNMAQLKDLVLRHKLPQPHAKL